MVCSTRVVRSGCLYLESPTPSLGAASTMAYAWNRVGACSRASVVAAVLMFDAC